MSMYDRNHYNIVFSLQLIKINKKIFKKLKKEVRSGIFSKFRYPKKCNTQIRGLNIKKHKMKMSDNCLSLFQGENKKNGRQKTSEVITAEHVYRFDKI